MGAPGAMRHDKIGPAKAGRSSLMESRAGLAGPL